MTMADGALPDFDRPPVIEVVFAVAIDPLPLSVMDLSVFALERFGGEFPIRQEQPPLRMTRESFDSPIPQLGPSLALLAGQPPVRLWLQSADQTRLIQLQRDYLAANWQKAGGARPYPRYESVESFFSDTWDTTAEFAHTKGTALNPVQCELTYINQIEPGEMWSRHGQLSRVLRLVADPVEFLPEPEDGQLAVRYRMQHEGRDVGRLYVNGVSAFRPADMTPVIQLTMTARGAPLAPGKDGMISFFRLAHEWIVRGFAAVTTDAAQANLWGRRQ